MFAHLCAWVVHCCGCMLSIADGTMTQSSMFTLAVTAPLCNSLHVDSASALNKRCCTPVATHSSKSSWLHATLHNVLPKGFKTAEPPDTVAHRRAACRACLYVSCTAAAATVRAQPCWVSRHMQQRLQQYRTHSPARAVSQQRVLVSSLTVASDKWQL